MHAAYIAYPCISCQRRVQCIRDQGGHSFASLIFSLPIPNYAVWRAVFDCLDLLGGIEFRRPIYHGGNRAGSILFFENNRALDCLVSSLPHSRELPNDGFVEIKLPGDGNEKMLDDPGGGTL